MIYAAPIARGTFAPIVVNDIGDLHTPDGKGVWYSARGARRVSLVVYEHGVFREPGLEEYNFRLIENGRCVFCEECHAEGRLVSFAEALLFVERGLRPGDELVKLKPFKPFRDTSNDGGYVL